MSTWPYGTRYLGGDVEVADFLRFYQVRAPNIMWLLGAGASAAANIPTAYDLIWDFKRTLYCAAQKVSIRTCEDLGNPSLRARLQRYFDSLGTFPAQDADDEYASYFEAAYPAESDRRRYIDQFVSNAAPSYGHLALSALLKLDRMHVIWTTNFDRVVEDAAILLLGGSGKLVTATLDTAAVALQAMNEGRWPLLVKLHGDFQSRRLKNTTDELRAQDVELRRAFVEGCKRFGLAVVGYSGRDRSVMEALHEAIDGGHGYPSGLFWFYRAQSPCLLSVTALIASAAAKGIQADLIPVETFDELMADLLLLQPDLPADITEHLNHRPRRLSSAPVPQPGRSWPVIRLNALPILVAPMTCRRIVCSIGGAAEVQAAIEATGADVVAARRSVGVLAFGSDSEVRKAFESRGITEFDLHAIESRRLRYDSAELGLLYDALARALAREYPIRVDRRRSSLLLIVDAARAEHAGLRSLRQVIGGMTGTVPGSGLGWSEAARLRLEYRLDRIFLLFEPTVWVEHADDDSYALVTKEFVRERLATRYNRVWNQLLEAWAEIIVPDAQERTVRAFGVSDGVDASFTISKITAFSRRGRPL
ncbi:MAG: SIR2 family protein [Chloroflexi bacterium]|nr:SIR2 family protein [Chloroflexota bacterium]